MSFLALTIVVSHIALYGVAREPDEGAAAHLWQILMVLQLPIIAWHAARWLRKEPGLSAKILAVQILGVLAALAPVWWLGL
jgi:hypothetical protein